MKLTLYFFVQFFYSICDPLAQTTLFQVLIKEYGRKRLQEMADHRMKRLLARNNKKPGDISTATSADISPMQTMLSNSTSLMHRVLQLGRNGAAGLDPDTSDPEVALHDSDKLHSSKTTGITERKHPPRFLDVNSDPNSVFFERKAPMKKQDRNGNSCPENQDCIQNDSNMTDGFLLPPMSQNGLESQLETSGAMREYSVDFDQHDTSRNTDNCADKEGTLSGNPLLNVFRRKVNNSKRSITTKEGGIVGDIDSTELKELTRDHSEESIASAHVTMNIETEESDVDMTPETPLLEGKSCAKEITPSCNTAVYMQNYLQEFTSEEQRNVTSSKPDVQNNWVSSRMPELLICKSKCKQGDARSQSMDNPDSGPINGLSGAIDVLRKAKSDNQLISQPLVTSVVSRVQTTESNSTPSPPLLPSVYGPNRFRYFNISYPISYYIQKCACHM